MTSEVASRDDVRNWLKGVIGKVTPATVSTREAFQHGHALSLAFTHAGLTLLGGDAMHAVGFSREFVEGMAASEHRQRQLGDFGAAAPVNWHWGGPTTPQVLAMIFVFASDESRLDALVAEQTQHARACRLTIPTMLRTLWLDDDREHFGFHDGIAQPDIAGLGPQGESPARDAQEIPTGEVLLGYRNAYDVIPRSPTVPETAASARHLQAPVEKDPAALAQARDLGRNGSYVVFRQLQQDVKGFWRDLDRRALGDPLARKRLAAKIVGRWPNGAPLVLHPDAEPIIPDLSKANAFTYEADLHGDKCPVGAHIRRTNPRDGMRPGREESIKVANRHRLLRRGRAYGTPLAKSFDPDEILTADDRLDGRRGLHFICFNTDIARQFEFVQSTWANGGKFDGLYRDPDALVAPQGPAHPPVRRTPEIPTFTIQRAPVRERQQRLQRVVTTVGGAYLFMPAFSAMRFLIEAD